MNVNFPERIWCNSRLRQVVQQREVFFWKRLARKHGVMRDNGDARFLEIGCGNGAGALMVMRAFSPASMVALDVDPDMLRRAVRRLQRLSMNGGTPKLRLLEADAQRIPVVTGSMDAAFNFGIIHHLEDWRRGIRELGRVLKPGGCFFFEEIFPPLYANWFMRHIVLHPTRDRFHGPEFKATLRDAGLRLEEGYRESRFGIVGLARKISG